MRVIAATFTDHDRARAVLAAIRQRFDLGAADADLAPLGTAEDGEHASTVLAGRFTDARAAEVHRLVDANGGTVVVDIDEEQTAARRAAAAASREVQVDPTPERARQPRISSLLFDR